MASKIEILCRQAVKTFSRRHVLQPSGAAFEENLRSLKSVADKVTASDVGLEDSLATMWARSRTSVTYIRIYEDSDVSIGIFVLKPHASLPLHNHPQMRGILKVISGQVEVRSFTPTDCVDWEAAEFLTCEKHPPVSVGPESPACTLDEVARNLHEISHSEGTCAAFLDVLAPPYDDDDDCCAGEVRRPCFYYRVEEEQKLEDGRTMVHLERVPTPSSYTCDSAPYLGPSLQGPA